MFALSKSLASGKSVSKAETDNNILKFFNSSVKLTRSGVAYLVANLNPDPHVQNFNPNGLSPVSERLREAFYRE